MNHTYDLHNHTNSRPAPDTIGNFTMTYENANLHLHHTHQSDLSNSHHSSHHHYYNDNGTYNSSPHSSNLGQLDPNNHSKKQLDKNSDEYKKRRERNNVAVRKSREKAKMRSRETERRVSELSKENQIYRAQYEELRREFNVLKSLLLKTGLTEQVIEDEAQCHAVQEQLNDVYFY